MSDGIRLVNAIRTVGTFMKWVIVGLIGILAGFVMVGESIGQDRIMAARRMTGEPIN